MFGRPAAGFTNIEILGAIVISLILGVIAISGMSMFEREMPVRHQAKRLSHAFSTARSFAIANNAVYSVRINRSLGHFFIDETDEAGNPIVSQIVRPEPFDAKVTVEAIYFGSVLVTEDLVSVRFMPDGSSDDVRVFLRMTATPADRPGAIHTVRLYGPTGQSRVFENEQLELTTPEPL